MVRGITSIDAVCLSSARALLYYCHDVWWRSNTALRHTDSVRHVMATNCSAPSKPKLDRTRANKVATSLLSIQCVWALTICFYTIITKCNGPLNTIYCHTNSVGYEMVVACCCCLQVQIGPHQVGYQLRGITSINAVRLSIGNVLLYYWYHVEWATNRGYLPFWHC